MLACVPRNGLKNEHLIILFEYLPAQEQLLLASTCQRLYSGLQYHHILLSIMFGGDTTQKNKLDVLLACWRNGFIHSPSPVRLLRLLLGQRCEEPSCNNAVTSLPAPLCLHFCSHCIAERTSSVPPEHVFRHITPSEQYLVKPYLKEGDPCGLALDLELQNRYELVDEFTDYLESLPGSAEDICDIYDLMQVVTSSQADHAQRLRNESTTLLCNTARILTVWDDIGRRMTPDARDWFRDTALGKLSLQKYPPNPLTATEEGRLEIAWSLSFSHRAIYEANLMSDDFFDADNAFHKYMKLWRQATIARNIEHGFSDDFIDIVSMTAANDIATACVEGDKISALCIALLQNDLSTLNMALAFQECNRLNEKLIVGATVHIEWMAVEVWANAFQNYSENAYLLGQRDAPAMTAEIEQLYHNTVEEYKEYCKRIAEYLSLRWVTSTIRRHSCGRKKDDVIRNELKALFAEKCWTELVMNQPYIVELLLNRDYKTFYEITTAENFGEVACQESEDYENMDPSIA